MRSLSIYQPCPLFCPVPQSTFTHRRTGHAHAVLQGGAPDVRAHARTRAAHILLCGVIAGRRGGNDFQRQLHAQAQGHVEFGERRRRRGAERTRGNPLSGVRQRRRAQPAPRRSHFVWISDRNSDAGAGAAGAALHGGRRSDADDDDDDDGCIMSGPASAGLNLYVCACVHAPLTRN